MWGSLKSSFHSRVNTSSNQKKWIFGHGMRWDIHKKILLPKPSSLPFVDSASIQLPSHWHGSNANPRNDAFGCCVSNSRVAKNNSWVGPISFSLQLHKWEPVVADDLYDTQKEQHPSCQLPAWRIILSESGQDTFTATRMRNWAYQFYLYGGIIVHNPSILLMTIRKTVIMLSIIAYL